MMEQQDVKYIVEIRTGYTRTDEGIFSGGEWHTLKDELGCEQIFDFYFEAHRMLEARCPELKMFGSNVGRVKDVVMIDRKKDK